eukprot:Blabericola_migrator_1__11425@NODE_678_length_6912_cov_111_209642_g492_i0_p6_GENE_NODE_678_length_6912_cov_111_209642_g492_i0NODE_678_length_6912_cov_111_209642_g492_i0_p6_ORF_typecomplete_len111_score9_42_NODE_678_length_6912_cov_111_209642_g492_i056065938
MVVSNRFLLFFSFLVVVNCWLTAHASSASEESSPTDESTATPIDNDAIVIHSLSQLLVKMTRMVRVQMNAADVITTDILFTKAGRCNEARNCTCMIRFWEYPPGVKVRWF